MHHSVKYRFGQRSSIFYVLVMDEQPKGFPFVPPREFDNDVLKFVSCLPKDILQISESLAYFELTLRNALDDPYQFQVKYAINLKEYLELMPINRPYLFFIDPKSKHLSKTIELLARFHNGLRFYHFFGDDKQGEDLMPNQIKSPGHFLQTVYLQQEEMFALMGPPFKHLAPETGIFWKEFYEFPFFVAAQTNFRAANTITGNFPYGLMEEVDKPREEQIKANADFSVDSQKHRHSFFRQQQIIEQADKIDFFVEKCFEHKLIIPVHGIEPFYAPLILISPFQNPDVKGFLQEDIRPEHREYFFSFDLEQTENYINLGKPPKNVEGFMLTAQLTRSRTQYLDDVAFLHSSFSTSPIIRLPAQGKTMYRSLSFFRNEAAIRLTSPGNRGKILRTVQSFGKQLSKRTISTELNEKLREENRQIVAISDLPIEWLDIDGIPLCFTHDVCRLPETGLHGLMANFVAHQQWKYAIPKDILKKTLVIFGSDEPQFRRWYSGVRMTGGKNGVVIKECLSIEALRLAIEEIKPDLLIIDSHGGYEPSLRSSVLYIGKEKLTGDVIVSQQISAPLVFLSACSTSPTYGTINTIANAFFEVGALSVTTTYLPISVDAGSILYIRLLNNLATASISPVHQNWLAFISHLLRTSAVGSAYGHFREKHPDDPTGHPDAQANDYTHLQSFYLRRKIYQKLMSSTGPKLANAMPEFLFYSILGRADLLKFEIWLERFQENNPVTN